MMKPGFLTQIMVTPVTGITKDKAHKHADEMEFKMYSFNGCVYSVSDGKPLFLLSDLVDYNYNSTTL